MNKENWLKQLQKICSKQELCKHDIYKKLSKSDLSDSDKEWIINQLEQQHYIDENRFIQAFINDKYKFNHWGEEKIRHALVQKRLPLNKINHYLSTILDDKDMEEKFVSIAQKKLLQLKENDEQKRTIKLYRFLLQKGLPYEKARKIVKIVLNKSIDFD